LVIIDLGNSRLKVGLLCDDNKTAVWNNADLASLNAWLSTLYPTPHHRALGVNVAGPQQGVRVATAFADHGIELTWMRAQQNAYGIVNGYERPEKLGADRWAAMVGVRAQIEDDRPFIIATFGTATTIDTVGRDGRFVGGLILPGPVMMRAALAQGTAELPLATGAVRDFPLTTDDAIDSGVAASQAGAVLRQWHLATAHVGEVPCIYVAGGGWPVVERETRRLITAMIGNAAPEIRFLPHPVLDGLAYIGRLKLKESC
jgi:type III pantothenate kinase